MALYNNVQETANRILGLKNDWNTATAKGDNEKAKQIAANAQTYYKQLRDSGYEGMAQKLYDSNYEQSKNYINDYFAKQGRSAIRPYFYNLGKKYGMSQSDIDNALTFDETTGEVTFGGKNMGKPAAISSDGVSYCDNDTLDNSFKDYVSRTGTTRSKSAYVDQENENYSNKLNQTWDMNISDRNVVNTDIDDLKSTITGNPFTTDEAKAILGKYDLSAIQGRNNQLASGAASNGGNVDSYSAANAMRQQASLYSMGQQAVLDAYNSKVNNLKDVVSLRSDNAQSKIDNARSILSDLGVQIDRVFNQDETAKNNAVSRAVAKSEVTGYVPKEWQYENNPYFNANGELINENLDYAEALQNAQNRLASATTESEKNIIKTDINNLKQAATYKMMNNPAYSKYLQKWSNDYGISITPQQTESGRVVDAQLKNSLDVIDRNNQQEKDMAKINNDASLAAIKAQTDSKEKIAGIEAQNNLDQITTTAIMGGVNSKPSLTATQAAEAIKNGEKSQSVIDAYNYYYGTSYTPDNPPKVGSNSDVDSEPTEEEKDNKIRSDINDVYNNSSKTVQNYIRNVLEPLIFNNTVTETEVKENLIGNSQNYDLEVDDIKSICEALGIDKKWIDDYKNRGLFGWGSGVKKR